MTRQPRFNVGDRVRINGRAETGAIVSPGRAFRSTFHYQVVVGGDPDWTYLPEDELELVESGRRSPAAWLLDQPLADAATFAEYYTMLKLGTRLSDHLYSYLSSRTVFRVYQFKPVLKLLSSPIQSLLIADEVGLGKTIEAGLIWTELDARMSLDRVLVVCPAGLRRKWRFEMERRFDRDVDVWERASDVDGWLERFGQLGESMRGGIVAGLETLRSRRILAALRDAAPPFDLVIVDEAHHMRNRNTLSFELGEFLSEASDYLVFLTATPVNLGTPDLFNLLNLLSPEEFDTDAVFDQLVEPNRHINAALKELRQAFPPDLHAVRARLVEVETTSQSVRYTRNPIYLDIKSRLDGPEASRGEVVDLQRRISDLNTLGQIYTRTRKRDLAEKFAVRRARTLEVDWTDVEWAVYQAATRFVLSRFTRLRETGAPVGFVAIMPQRQAASCIPVMRDYLLDAIQRRRLDTDFEEGEEDIPDEDTGIRDPELAALNQALSAARALGDQDSKFERFARELAQIRDEDPTAQLLVFSFFRRTLTYLHERLSAKGLRVERMDGGTKRDERERLMQDFRDGTFDILLSSEIGAEGLDFEFCRYLVNYDLPWNPMRLEQRIGRLDRFGQLHDSIVIVNFHIPGTIETDIFERLYDRIGIFEASIGELEPILGEAVRELERRVIEVGLDPEEERRETDRIAQAIEERKSQLAVFEETRAQLVGQDDYVIEQLDEIQQQRRYITPFELERLFRGFLEREVRGRWALREDAHINGLFYFQVGGRFGDLLRPHLQGLGVQAVDLLSCLEAGTGFTVTFTPEVAYQRQVEFLSIRHPFIKGVLEHYGDRGRLYRAGAITLPGPRAGEFVFFIFILNATGLVPRQTLLAVAIDSSTFVVDDAVSALVLPGLAAEQLSSPNPMPVMLPDIVDRAYVAAEMHAFEARSALKEDLSRTNQAIAIGRIESLRASMDLRIGRLVDQLGITTDERIRRMKEAQVRNIRNRVETKISEVRRQQDVTVDVRPLAGGWLETTI